MEKKFTDQEENPLSQRMMFLFIFLAILLIVGVFTLVFRFLSFDIPQGNAHVPKEPLIHSHPVE